MGGREGKVGKREKAMGWMKNEKRKALTKFQHNFLPRESNLVMYSNEVRRRCNFPPDNLAYKCLSDFLLKRCIVEILLTFLADFSAAFGELDHE